MNGIQKLNKFLMIFLTSFTLVHLNVMVASSVMAQETGQQGTERTDDTGVKESEIRINEDGVAEKDLSVTTEDTGSQLATADFLTLISMLAMGLIAASLVQYTPTQMDMWIAIAGGVIYIGGEIYAIFTGQEEITDQEFKVTIQQDGEMDNKQVEALEKQKASYESVKETADIKWMLQAAAGVAFIGAAAAAVIQTTNWKAAELTCVANTAAGIAQGPPIGAFCAEALAAYKAIFAQQAAVQALASPSCTKYAEYQAIYAEKQPQLAACAFSAPGCTYEQSMEKLSTTCSVVNTATGFNSDEQLKEWKNFGEFGQKFASTIQPQDLRIDAMILLSQLTDETLIDELTGKKTFHGNYVGFPLEQEPQDSVDIFLAEFNKEMSKSKEMLVVPNANAGLMSYLGLGATVAGILAGTMGYSLKFVDKFMADPMNRAIVYGGMAALAGASALVTRGIVSSAEENIAKLDSLIQRFRNTQDGRFDGSSLDGGERTAVGIDFLNPTETLQNRNLTNDNSRLPCATVKAAQSSSQQKCPPIEEKIKKSTAFGGLGSTFGQIATSAGSTADGIQNSSTLGAGTIESASSLASQSAVARRGLDAANKKLNDLLKKNNKKGFDFDGQSKKFLGGVRSAVAKKLRQSGSSPKSLASALGQGNLIPNNPEEAAAAALKEETKKAAEDVKQKGIALNPKRKGFNFDFGTDGGGTTMTDAEAEAALSELAENQSEIVQDESASIFEIISYRYIKSGMSRLFEEVSD